MVFGKLCEIFVESEDYEIDPHRLRAGATAAWAVEKGATALALLALLFMYGLTHEPLLHQELHRFHLLLLPDSFARLSTFEAISLGQLRKPKEIHEGLWMSKSSRSATRC